jgi:hypothetical protein
MRRLLAANRLEFSSTVIDEPLGEVGRGHINTDHRITKAKIAGYFHDTSRQETFAMGRERDFRAVVHDNFSPRFKGIANPTLALIFYVRECELHASEEDAEKEGGVEILLAKGILPKIARGALEFCFGPG